MRTQKDYENWIIFKIPLPPLEDIDIPNVIVHPQKDCAIVIPDQVYEQAAKEDARRLLGLDK